MGKITLIILFCLSTCFRAECDTPLAALIQNYAQMHDVNITYESLITCVLTPYSIDFESKKINAPVDPSWQVRVFFCADKKGFDWKVTRLGKISDVSSFSYDGTTYQALYGWLHTLNLSKKNTEVPPYVVNLDSLFVPAAMFAKSHNYQNQLDSLWRDVTDPSFWTSIPTALSPTKGQLSGIVDGKKMTVTLSDKNSFLGISRIESYQGTPDKLLPLMTYTCSEVGEVSFEDNGLKKTFFYPKKASMQFFYDLNGELLRTATHEITKISVNNPQFDESKFTVDPSSVQKIHDLDSNVWITVRK
jgi:hypothetical protein